MELSVTARVTDAKGDVSAVTIPGRFNPMVSYTASTLGELIRLFETVLADWGNLDDERDYRDLLTNAPFLPNDIRASG